MDAVYAHRATTRSILAALAFVALALAVTAPAAAQELSNDAQVTGEIVRAGQLDRYSFDATAGQTLFLNVADRDNTNLAPSVRVLSPSGAELAADTGSFTATVRAVTVTESGRHSVRVQDVGADDVGAYELFLALVTGANELGRLSDADLRRGTMTLGNLETFTIRATAGDQLYLNLADSDNTNFAPDLLLYAPDGSFVASDTGSFSATLRDIALTQSGTYTVIAKDVGSDDAGAYALFSALVPGANERGRLANGERVEGEMELGDLETYTFRGTAGQRVYANLADVGNTNFAPDLLLHAPDGSLISADTGSFTATLRNVELPSTGTYTLVAKDVGADDAGRYALDFARVPGADEGGALDPDVRRDGVLALGGIDTWTFDARVGDRVHVNLADVDNTNFSPDLLLHAPDGSVVASDTGSFAATISGYTVVQDGPHTVVVEDVGADDAGGYALYATRAPGAAERGALIDGDSFVGPMVLGDIETFAFGARPGGQVTVSVGDVDGTNFSPSLVVYDRTGATVASDTGSVSASVSFAAPVDGTYTVVVQDVGADDAGTYSLDFAYTGPAPPTVRRSIELAPGVWHLLSIPAGSNRTYGQFLSPALDPADYASGATDTPWIVYVYEPELANPGGAEPGAYREVSLSESPVEGTGFWLLHVGPSPVSLSLPARRASAPGVTGGGCAPGLRCVTPALAERGGLGGWRIAGVPSFRPTFPDELRFVTDTACSGGCTLVQAAASGLSIDGLWAFDPTLGRAGGYVFRSGRDTLVPWRGAWARSEPAAADDSPRLAVPVR